MDFFQSTCQEPTLTHKVFGLCDDTSRPEAYTDIHDPTKWTATVKNNKEQAVTFTAIDKCVIKDGEHIGRGRCDAMLTSADHLYLIELKSRSANWQTESIDQLISTINFLKEHHDVSGFKHKKAFACNKKHGKFQVIDTEFNLQFYRTHGFRIDIQSEIVVI